jgi:hypothetical protein
MLDKITDVPLASEEVIDAIKNGDIDCTVVLASPTKTLARIQEIAVTHPINIIDLKEVAESTTFFKDYPGSRKAQFLPVCMTDRTAK